MQATSPYNLYELIREFDFKSIVRVQFHQVDSFQILHNIQYLYFFENSRIEFLQSLNLANNLNDLINTFPVMTVHHSIDYLAPARFNDVIEIYTRVKEIGTSSIKFENIAVSDKRLLARGLTVYVYINPATGESQPIPANIKQIFKKIHINNNAEKIS